MIKKYIIFIHSVFLSNYCFAQNTVGLLNFNSIDQYSEGYNLIFPHNQSDVFLFNECGEIVHQWTGPNEYRNHNTAYLLDNGDMIRTLRKDGDFSFIWEVGGENLIECVTWDNTLKWRFSYLNSTSRLHHDIEPTPQGTVFLISWDHHSVEEAIALGRDSVLFNQAAFSPDKIIEYDPALDSIIWEWKTWDHLVQNRDPLKPNYGNLKDHPNRININWENNFGRADWMHVNSIDYNPHLDQIMINVPTFNEIWIIDHSTTTEEAKSSSGGKSGKGGDLLWRWGNPQTYDRGTEDDQKLFFQHDALWACDHLSESHDDYGNISVFNNNKEIGHSHIGMIKPEFDNATFEYLYSTDSTFYPESFYYEWSHPEPDVISSSGLSSVQILPNNNKLICSGRNGLTIELTPEEEIIWVYKTPYRNGFRVEQGTQLEHNNNLTFRLRKYPLSYSAFDNKDLIPMDYLELNPDETYCDRLLDNESIEIPSLDIVKINNSLMLLENQYRKEFKTYLINVLGNKIAEFTFGQGNIKHDIGFLESGYYILYSNEFKPFCFIKI